MTDVASLDCNTTLNAPYTSPYISMIDFKYMSSLITSTQNLTVSINWSIDGITSDKTDTISVTAGSPSEAIHTIKAHYISITYTPAITPATVRSQNLFRIPS